MFSWESARGYLELTKLDGRVLDKEKEGLFIRAGERWVDGWGLCVASKSAVCAVWLAFLSLLFPR